jgi:aspartyl-tRNA(Asn)/glutamyl-tRNA(Gln) amidotransferase subunit A
MFDNMTATQLSVLIREKKAKPSEVCEFFLRKSQENEPRIAAFITLDGERAMAQARKLDGMPITADTPALHGLPVALKDNICTTDMPTTCASRMLEGYISPKDADVTARLRESGAVIIGKTNLDEFAMGSSGETSAYIRPNSGPGRGTPRNPHDLSRVPGGSSSGSAAAVAAGSVPLALGTDTGGSIRQPASHCGIVGYKPSFGMVSGRGVVSSAGDFTQVGPMSACVDDAILLASAIADLPPLEKIKSKRIGVLMDSMAGGLSEDVEFAVLAAAKKFEKMGATLVDIPIKHMRYALPIYYALGLAEAKENLEGFNDRRTACFGDEVKRRLMLGAHFHQYRARAHQLRQRLKEDFDAAFSQVDVLLGPVAPTVAPHFGEKMNEVQSILANTCTVPANICGLPAISVPCGTGKNGLPVGMHLIARQYDDAKMLAFARAFETGF